MTANHQSPVIFPTRARTTGFALVDRFGHLAGGISFLFIAPLIPHIGALDAMLLIGGFLVLGAIFAQFGATTRRQMLEEVSPNRALAALKLAKQQTA